MKKGRLELAVTSKKKNLILKFWDYAVNRLERTVFLGMKFTLPKKYLSPIRYYLPSKFDAEIQKKLTMKKMMQAISSLKNEEAFYSSDFSYEPIPGPFLRGLNNTKELLKNYNSEQHFPC